MSKFEKNINVLWWLLAIIITALMLFYVFTYDNYNQPDFPSLMHTIQMAAKSMWKQDMVGLWRPGYLLDVPFFKLGLPYSSIKWVYWLCLLFSFIWFMWALDKRAMKTVVFPISFITLYAIYTAHFRDTFNYYGNPPLFVILGLASYFTAHMQGRLRYLWLIFSGFCFAQLSMANLALIPASFIAIIFLAYRSKKAMDYLLIVSTILWTALFLWLYLIPGHALAIYLHYATTGNLRTELAERLSVTILLALYFYIVWQIFTFDSVLKARGLWRSYLICIALIALMIFVVFRLLNVFGVWTLASVVLCTPIAAWFALYMSLYYLCKDKIASAGHYEERSDVSILSRYATAIITIFIVLLINRIVSVAGYVSWLYFPLIGIVFWLIAEKIWHSPKRHFAYLAALIVFGIVPYLRIATVDNFHLIGANRWVGYAGIHTTLNLYKLQHHFTKAYQANNCENKPLLAYFDLPNIYWLADRAAAFNQAWIAGYIITPESKYVSDAGLKHWLTKHPHWCVFWHYSPVTSEHKIRFMRETALMKRMAKDKTKIGSMGNAGVWLYVR